MLPMKTLSVSAAMRTCVLIVGLIVVPLAATALAQNSTSTQEGGSSSTQTTKTTTTTSSSQPTQTTTTWVDPFWLTLGGIALLAIILIVVFASRGRRGHDRTAVVHERETVIKKE
jgi:hypothetical protein